MPMHTTPGVWSFACGLLLGVVVSQWRLIVSGFYTKALGELTPAQLRAERGAKAGAKKRAAMADEPPGESPGCAPV